MDQFTVPKFIEHEAKIVGPLTFKQFIFVGIAGAICFFFYFTTSLFVFILSVIFFGGVSLILAFYKVGGRSLPLVLKNFFGFFVSPKIYLWRKKGSGLPPKIIAKKEVPEEETVVPKIGGKSRLDDLSKQVEIK